MLEVAFPVAKAVTPRLAGWLVDGLLDRAVIEVRALDQALPEDGGKLSFEVQNVTDHRTSLEPSVRVLYHRPKGSRVRREKLFYDVLEPDRALPPFEPRRFTAAPRERLPPYYLFTWFRTYVFSQANGPDARVYVRSALLETVSPPRFMLERLRYAATGGVRRLGATTQGDQERRRRGAQNRAHVPPG